jgi:hypothetical protein
MEEKWSFGYRELILIYSGNESYTFGTGFIINKKYKKHL